MAKKVSFWGMPAIALVFGMIVFAAPLVSAAPKSYVEIEPLMPDAQSAVVYFLGAKGCGNVWDGETPIGTFDQKKGRTIIAYKTTPGEHYFMANATNWAILRANLEPNKRYLVAVSIVPGPFSRIAIIRPQEPADGAAIDNVVKAYKKPISFDDTWRTSFAQGKRLQEAQRQLESAKGKSMDVNLRGEHGR